MNALVVVPRLRLEIVAQRSRVHPDVVRRLSALGLLEPVSQRDGELWFAPSSVGRLARIERLHRDLSLNYAATGVVLELLDRIDELESALRGARTGE
jgi:chaperone modulatory protein CbpM